jgi:hypothetical protein
MGTDLGGYASTVTHTICTTIAVNRASGVPVPAAIRRHMAEVAIVSLHGAR